MSANTAARRSFANLAPTMRKQYALTLRECRLSLPVEPPWGPLESVVALQHFARGLTRLLGYDVDRPRNLAKSVTVE